MDIIMQHTQNEHEHKLSEKVEAIDAVLSLVFDAFNASKELAKGVGRGAGGREVAVSITKLQEAQHWLREALSELGTLAPVPEHKGE